MISESLRLSSALTTPKGRSAAVAVTSMYFRTYGIPTCAPADRSASTKGVIRDPVNGVSTARYELVASRTDHSQP